MIKSKDESRKEKADSIPRKEQDDEQTYHGINLRWRVLGDETSSKDPDLNNPPFFSS